MSHGLRLLVFTQELPYPPVHGGRADVWRRLCAFRQLGCSVALVCWYDDDEWRRPSSEHFDEVRKVADDLLVFRIRRDLLSDTVRLLRVGMGLPSHVAARVLRSAERRQVDDMVDRFCPDAVFLDCPYGGDTALKVASRRRMPLFYRSHNVEHRYFSGQARAATRFRDRMAWTMARVGLERFERRVLSEAVHFFDISADDLEFWKSQGFTSGSWLPPLAARPHAPRDEASARQSRIAEIGFLGNLRAPNNVQGLRWLVSTVLPIVWRTRPDARLAIGGSNPADEVVALASTDSRIVLHREVLDTHEFLCAMDVLVNPVLSGSGVNVKTLDMLTTDRPIASTSQGVAGLPLALKELCRVADSPEGLARHIVAESEAPTVDMRLRESRRELFSEASVERALKLMCEVSSRRHTTPPNQSGPEGD